MAEVVRLVTVADVGDDAGLERMSISARLGAELTDGRRVVLLDDRGWSASLRGPGARDAVDAWSLTSEADIVEDARVVVGPDEPFGDHSQADMERDHWTALASRLAEQGVFADAARLARLPHDVELTEALRARIAGRGG